MHTSSLTLHPLAASLLVVGALLAVTVPALAEPQTTVRAIASDAKAEARWRFDRGLKLYNQGDYTGALVEFERAYALTQHEVVRYNIGLVYAKLGDSKNSVRALEPLVKAPPPTLKPEQVERARAAYEEQRLLVGSLRVSTNVDKAAIRIDNMDVGQAPAEPFVVNAGEHVVSVFAPGYEPRRTTVLVAGRTEQSLNAELLPLEQAYSQLVITTSVPDVDVFANGQLVGATPFTASIAFKPGVHTLVFRRPGYRDATEMVSLHPGSTGEVQVKMEQDPTGSSSGRLTLGVPQEHAVVWVDGELRPDFAKGLRLPLGRHQLKIQRAGFYDLEREFRTEAGHIDVELFPTSEYLEQYVDSARAQRTWAWVAMGGGAALAVGGAVFLGYNAGVKDDRKKAFDAVSDEIAAQPPRTCTTDNDECGRLASALNELEDARFRDLYGWLGVGVGAAGIVGGVLLHTLGDDPDKYEPDSDDDVFGSLHVDVGLGAARLQGAF
jgi:hypothetical protein